VKQSPPERRCIVTRETAAKGELLRFVVSPEGQLVFDLRGDLPGRGMWVTPRRELVEQAIAKGHFPREAGQAVKIPAGLTDEIARQLHQQVLRYIERACVSREMLAGFEKVLAALQAGKLALLVHAEDAAEDGCRKLDKYADNGVRILRFGSREQLEKAAKRENPVHLGLKSQKLALVLSAAYDRWAGFTGKDAV
jgi:uncharacterized protein